MFERVTNFTQKGFWAISSSFGQNGCLKRSESTFATLARHSTLTQTSLGSLYSAHWKIQLKMWNRLCLRTVRRTTFSPVFQTEVALWTYWYLKHLILVKLSLTAGLNCSTFVAKLAQVCCILWAKLDSLKIISTIGQCPSVLISKFLGKFAI